MLGGSGGFRRGIWGGETALGDAAAEKADPPPKEALAVELVAGKPNSLLVPEDVRKSLGIRKGDVDQIAVAERPTRDAAAGDARLDGP